MAELKANTTLGGKAIWGASNLPLVVKDLTLEYKGFKIYTEHDKPEPSEINAYTKQETDLALESKVDKVLGKGLSEIDFTSDLNDKLESIEDDAQKNVATNLVFLTTETEGSLQSTTGNTVSITQASTTKAGLISSSDKVKLNSLPSGTSGIIQLSGGGTGAATASGARTNLGLGNAATHNYGTAVNTIAQGNDSRIVNAANKTEVTNSLNLKADKAIRINTGPGLTGSGDLSTDRTISITYGTAVNTVAQGNDSRINNGQLAFNRLDIGATAATARSALQLGNAATHNYGTTNNSIMQGNDARVLAAATKTELTDGLALKSDKNINISVGAGLSGGGTLAANRTINITWGTTLNTVPQGNDQRILNGQSAFNRLDIGATARTARTALQLGNTATHNYGYDLNTIAQGNDFRIVNAIQKDQIAQGFGNDIDKIMSQNAITVAITNINSTVWPIGVCYTQYPTTPEPSSLFGGVWKLLFNTEGIFFRTEGAGAQAFGTVAVQEQTLGSHNHSASSNATGGHAHSVSGTAAYAGDHVHTYREYNAQGGVPGYGGYGNVRERYTSSSGGHTHSVSGTATYAGDHAHAITVGYTGDVENKPKNRTIRVWQRIE